MRRELRLGLTILSGLLLMMAALLIIRSNALVVYADSSDLHPNLDPSVKTVTSILTANGEVTVTHVITPPGGYPRLDQSVKTVTPTLTSTGVVTLYYAIEINNTGAYSAENATLTDVIPNGTTYNGDAQADNGSLNFTNGTLSWMGIVGFDSTVVVSFSVTITPTFIGTVHNTAVISDPLMTEPVTVAAETVVTDKPILTIGKTSLPAKPGANKPLTYTIIIANQGQLATGLPITVTDRVPNNTTLRDVGLDGFASPISDVVTWTRHITLSLGETTVFTFSVDVGNVPSGTVIANEDYQVTSSETGVTPGNIYTVTVVDPIFLLFKETWPDPPGPNRQMTYTLTVLNQGSLATNLVITDRVPAGVTYQSGGSLQPGGVVLWTWPSLDTGETAQFTFTVFINDVADVGIVNDDYTVCSAEGVCQPGRVLTSIVREPTFEAIAMLDPIAKKPGGGPGGPTTVTTTLVVRNLGPGNAIDAMALLKFERISVSANDLYAIPPIGTLPPFPDGPDCGEKCVSYVWVGDLAQGEVITFTALDQSTIGGEEGTVYTATVVVTDSLGGVTTEPVTGTATGRITHLANLIPIKSALPVIGPGQLLTYTITVVNSGLSTEEPPPPLLTDIVPTSVTVVSISDGGLTQTLTGTIVVSWTLPAMSTGDVLTRSFTVRVDDNVISGTQIVNNDYRTSWYESDVVDITGTVVLSNTGQPVTTTVREVGLIDSYKKVTPAMVLPGGVLTYCVHIVNSSGIALIGVTVEDLLPWQFSTYQIDAVASAGTIYEQDLVSVHWMGDLAPFSSEVITFSVVTNPTYQGTITNTAIISHPTLLNEIKRQAIAHVTEKPVLHITKSASPDPVNKGAELLYTIYVDNLGQRATNLLISDTIPANTQYVANSATAGGQLVSDQVQWQILELKPGESRTLEFRVIVQDGTEVINDQYAVKSAEGVVSVGAPVVTTINVGGNGEDEGDIYLPIILKNY